MSSTLDLIRNVSSQVAAGNIVDSNSIDPSVETHTSQGAVYDELDSRAENSTVDDLLPGNSEDTSNTDLQNKEPASSKEKSATSVKETLTITDDKGKRKIEVDFSDKDQLKKYVQMAYGARKWQAERDNAIQSKKVLETEISNLKSQWQTLEDLFAQGPEHLFDRLQGQQGAYKQLIQKELDKAKFLERASPAELREYEAQEKARLHAQEIEEERKANAEFRKQVQMERELAERNNLESKIHPTFDKYRFADKLGNSDDEQMFDEMLWNSALKRLEPYEEQGVQLTPELIEREFRSVAMALRNRIGVQAEKKAAKVVTQKKQEATENVQNKVKSGYKSGGSTADEARGLIQSGNLTGLLKGWSKYGNLFNK